jgi:hypothetical protein
VFATQPDESGLQVWPSPKDIVPDWIVIKKTLDRISKVARTEGEDIWHKRPKRAARHTLAAVVSKENSSEVASQNQREGVPDTTTATVSLRMMFAVFGEAGLLVVDFSSSSFLFISAIRTSFSAKASLPLGAGRAAAW